MHCLHQERVGIFFRIALHFPIAFVQFVELLRIGRHEHQLEVVGILQPEIDVGVSDGPDSFDWIGRQRGRLELRRQPRIVFVAQLVEQVFLVLEVNVDGGGRVFDFLRHLPHGDPFVALGYEELAGCIQDDFPGFGLFSLSALFNSHNVSQ